MNTLTLQTAAQVVRQTDQRHPADSVLRLELKRQHNLPKKQSRDVSQAVFTYYRWRGWLDPGSSVEEQLVQAASLRTRFQLNPASFSDRELIEKAVPAWIASYLTVMAEWARALQREPKLWLRARPGQSQNLAKWLGHCRAMGVGTPPDALEYLGNEDLFRRVEFQAGEFEIQDLSSQWVGLCCGPQPGETWWDACAGEGGKTLHLSDLMQNRGMIWASDRADWRLNRLKLRARRARAFNLRTVLWNGGKKPPTKTKFDGVLVDAPCSGVGTWHRNPHARWTTSAQDIQELSARQLDLISNVVPSLKPGGKLIYAACTMTSMETLDIVREVEQRFPFLQPLALHHPTIAAPHAQNHLQIWPQNQDGNGMFVAGWCLQ